MRAKMVDQPCSDQWKSITGNSQFGSQVCLIQRGFAVADPNRVTRCLQPDQKSEGFCPCYPFENINYEVI